MMQNAKETLEKALMTMEDRGMVLYEVCLNNKEIEYLLEMIDMAEDVPGTYEAYKTAYDSGFQRGYQRAVLDMAKKIKELRTYGGNKPEKRADGMPEHHA